jgi:hypothetical protein
MHADPALKLYVDVTHADPYALCKARTSINC